VVKPALYREPGISEPTVFQLEANYRGLDGSQIQLLQNSTAEFLPNSEKNKFKKKRHTEEQIAAILQEAEEGMAAPELCSKHGICEATLVRWKANYEGLDAIQMRLLRQRAAKVSQSSEDGRIRKRRHTEEQIVAILQEAEEGVATPELRSKYGISEPTLCRWKAKYRGLDASQVRMLRLRPAEVWKRLNEENYKLRQSVTELARELSDSRAKFLD
jgi:putative transposase